MSNMIVDSQFDDVDNDSSSNYEKFHTEEKYSAIQKYENEWSQLFDNENIKSLRIKAQNGMLRASRFRSVSWRVMLEVLSENSNEWITHVRNTRDHYQKLKVQMTADPRKSDEQNDDPLSQNTKSIWYQHFCDKELRGVIRQDVDRTFPGIEFFRKESIQNIMVDILFIYARVHPLMCYRQGMHEILAPLLFVIHCDQQAMLHTKEHGILRILIQEMLNPDYLEEDGFALFESIMNGIEFCYNIKDMEPTNTGYFPSNIISGSKNVPRPENEILSRLKYIRDFILKHADPELCEHLQTLDISFSLFGIRWLRLLFGREFPLQDLLVLWDAIFAEGKSFDFINYVVVSMLITIRSQLLNSDYTYCLTYLMRYPTITDIMYIINYALHLRNPQERNPPTMVNHVQNLSSASSNNSTVSMNSSNLLNKRSVSSLSLSSSTPSPNALNITNTNSLNRNNQKKILGKRLSKLQNQSLRLNAATSSAAAITRRTTDAAASTDTSIVEGFTLHDPEVLRVELNHAHNVMALCQLKLAQYHKVLLKSFNYNYNNNNSNKDVSNNSIVSNNVQDNNDQLTEQQKRERMQETQQVLDGICELCHLLRSRHYVTNNYKSSPLLQSQQQSLPEVERALEAGESRMTSPETTSYSSSTTPTLSSRRNSFTNQTTTSTTSGFVESNDSTKFYNTNSKVTSNSEFYVPIGLKKEERLTVFSQCVGVNGALIDGAPLSDPLRQIHGDNRYSVSDKKFLYEAVLVLNMDFESLRLK